MVLITPTKNKESFYGINYKSFDSQIFLLKHLSEKKEILLIQLKAGIHY